MFFLIKIVITKFCSKGTSAFFNLWLWLKMSYEFKSVCPVSIFPSVREFIFELAHLFSGTQLQLSGTSTLCKNKNVPKRDFWVDWTGKYKSINGALTFWKNVLFRKTAQVIGQNSLFQQVAGFLYYMYCQKESLISLNCDRGGHQMMLSETYFGSLSPSLPSHAQIPGFAWSWEDGRIKKSSELNINYFKRVEVLPPGFNTQNVKLRKALWFFAILWSSHLSSFFYM